MGKNGFCVVAFEQAILKTARSDASAKALIIGVGIRREALELGVTCPVTLARVGR